MNRAHVDAARSGALSGEASPRAGPEPEPEPQQEVLEAGSVDLHAAVERP